MNNLGGWAISKETYEWIINNIPMGSVILEFGSGDGTGVLCDKYKMYSVEDKKEWLNKYNSKYIHAPLVDGWYDVNVLKSEMPKHYDLLLIDGPEWERRGLLKHIYLFNQSCPILVDDTHRANDMFVAKELSENLNRKMQIFECGSKSFVVLL